ncbi:acyl-CoA synthetase, partial [Vibrio parahaemolyticus]|nr:acyl-CoA synthetase [Vibrio parahaemolyticus]
FTNLTTYVDRQSFSITDSKVMVNEFLQSDRQVVYQPILNVQYEYRMRDTGKY